ncbi:chromosome partitioning protein ParA, partial [Arthrospira platensis SPKY2]
MRDHGIDELGCVAEDKISVTPTQRQQAQQLIAQNQDPLSPWGWKDPRTTLLLDFWAELIPEAKFIFVYRTPWEVVDSLYRRSTDEALITSPEMAVKMWIFYNRQILNFYQNHPQRCLLANVYKVGNYSKDVVKALNQKFDLELRIDDSKDNFDDKLLSNDIIKSKKPGLIGAYFP